MILTQSQYFPEQKDNMVQEKTRCSVATDCKSLYGTVRAPSFSGEDRETSFELILTKGLLERTQSDLRWVPAAMQCADGLTKDGGPECDGLRALLLAGDFTLADESAVLAQRAQAKAERVRRREQRQAEGGGAEGSGAGAVPYPEAAGDDDEVPV